MTTNAMSPEAREKLLGVNPEQFYASLDDAGKEAFRRVDLAMDIEAWIEGNPVGQFFARMVAVERDDAMEALVKSMTDAPLDHAQHQKHHLRVRMCDQFTNWLADALSVGREAEQELKARELQD